MSSTNESMGQRIKRTRKARGLTQKLLAQSIDIRQQSLNALEKDQTKSPRNLAGIAKALNVTEEFLRYGNRIAINSQTEYTTIPVLTETQVNDFVDYKTLPTSEDIMDYLRSSKKYHQNTIAFDVFSDALECDNKNAIMQGDLVLVDPAYPAADGDAVAVRINGQLSVRIYRAQEGRKFLEAYKPAYLPLELNTDDIDVIGVIVETHRCRILPAKKT